MESKKHFLTAVLTKEEDMYVAENSETGVVSQGKSVDDALNNLKEAVELYLEEFPLKEPVEKPLMTIFEVIENAKTSKAVRA